MIYVQFAKYFIYHKCGNIYGWIVQCGYCRKKGDRDKREWRGYEWRVKRKKKTLKRWTGWKPCRDVRRAKNYHSFSYCIDWIVIIVFCHSTVMDCDNIFCSLAWLFLCLWREAGRRVEIIKSILFVGDLVWIVCILWKLSMLYIRNQKLQFAFPILYWF